MLTNLQMFLGKCKQFNLKTTPDKDYFDAGSLTSLEVEFPDHTRFLLRASTDWHEPVIDVERIE